MNRIVMAARVAHPIAAVLVVALVFVQVYLIADFIFGNSAALDTHMMVGKVVVGMELIVLLTALVGWWGNRPEITSSVVLVLVGGLQVSLAKDIGSSPQVHALHAVLALVVVALAWSIAARGRQELRGRPRDART